MNKYVISNGEKDACLLKFWNKHLGWVSRKEASLFSEEEASTLSLPDGGEWRIVINKRG